MQTLTGILRSHEDGQGALVVIQDVLGIGTTRLLGDLDEAPLGRIGFGQAILVQHFPDHGTRTIADRQEERFVRHVFAEGFPVDFQGPA